MKQRPRYDPAGQGLTARATALGILGSAVMLLLAMAPAEAATRARQEGTAARDARLRLGIEAGEVHSCAVKADGSVQCWGGNGHGQLGDGSTTDRLEPVTVGNLSQAVAVAAGSIHTCALRVNGTVRCWGANASGQLGDGTTSERHGPVAVRNLTGAVEIAVGGSHSCALLHDGTVRCWGENANGQLGDGSQTDRPNLVTVRNPNGSTLDRVTAIAAGTDHACALRADGTMRCWGFNGAGRLGDGTTTRRLRPVTVTNANGTALTGVVAISAGTHTCAVRADGTVRCWGDNTFGQLGDGTTTNRSNPVLVTSGISGDPGITDAVTVAAGTFFTCVLRAIGRAACWGDNAFGQLGDGTFTSRSTRGQVTALTTALAVTAGGGHACALLADGSHACWGLNVVGELGDGTTNENPRPVPVAGGAGGISGRDVAAGGAHTCAVRASGATACWGDNRRGQIGDNSDGALSPVAVDGLANDPVMIGPGDTHTCAVRAGGTVSCWGSDSFGERGDGSTFDERSITTVINSDGTTLGGVVAVTGGDDHTCALRAAGDVRCWGRNVEGQLGDGSSAGSTRAVRVSGLAEVVAISAGSNHTCALDAAGTVHCWGGNDFGQVGDGTRERRFLPTPVTGLTSVVGIAVGGDHTCALHHIGTVSCWGRNGFGQVGNDTTADQLTPVQVIGLTTVVAMAAGADHTCVLRADGTVRCWGLNSSGQLGDGTRTDRRTPVGGNGLTTAVALSAGGPSSTSPLPHGVAHTCALRVDGAPVCWGENASGQLGDGTTTDRLSPREVPSFRANVLPTATLVSNGQRVLATAVVNCPVDHQVTIEMTLVQGAVTGHGDDTDRCRGRLVEYPIELSVRQGPPFQPGTAHAEITATVRYGHTAVEVHEWDRDVELLASP